MRFRNHTVRVQTTLMFGFIIELSFLSGIGQGVYYYIFILRSAT